METSSQQGGKKSATIKRLPRVLVLELATNSGHFLGYIPTRAPERVGGLLEAALGRVVVPLPLFAG